MRRLGAISALALLLGPFGSGANTPRGHLKPFGGWQPGAKVEDRTDVPEPEDFYRAYCTSDNGNGRPVVFRGAAHDMPAMKSWSSDNEMLERFGTDRISGVEHQLKETRAGGQVKGMRLLRDFLHAYNTSDIYMVSKVPKRMSREVQFLPCLRCGGFLRFLDTNNLWMGRGGSKSVIHYDDQDNINCMLAGRKRFVFMHPSYKAQFEANPNSAANRFGWVDTDLDRSVPGYGAFMGRVDVDRMDLVKFPGWRDVNWSYAELEAGDCVYIPYQWYHQVTAEPRRSINVHIWYFRPAQFSAETCVDAGTAFADCTWGYEPPEGFHQHLGAVRKVGKKPTKCRSARGSKPTAEL